MSVKEVSEFSAFIGGSRAYSISQGDDSLSCRWIITEQGPPMPDNPHGVAARISEKARAKFFSRINSVLNDEKFFSELEKIASKWNYPQPQNSKKHFLISFKDFGESGFATSFDTDKSKAFAEIDKAFEPLLKEFNEITQPPKL